MPRSWRLSSAACVPASLGAAPRGGRDAAQPASGAARAASSFAVVRAVLCAAPAGADRREDGHDPGRPVAYGSGQASPHHRRPVQSTGRMDTGARLALGAGHRSGGVCGAFLCHREVLNLGVPSFKVSHGPEPGVTVEGTGVTLPIPEPPTAGGHLNEVKLNKN